MVYARKLIIVLQEWQAAVFGLEKDLAQRKMSGTIGVLFLALLLGAGEFTVVSFVVPSHPELVAIRTPTLNLFPTPTTTLSPDLLANGTPHPEGTGTAPATEQISGAETNCVAGKLQFTNLKSGDTLSTDANQITIEGDVTIPDNFGYYKYEYTAANSDNWITIQGNDKIRCKEQRCINPTEEPGDLLGNWDISELHPGDYSLRLVATDNDGKALPACQITVHITGPTPVPTIIP